MCHGSINGFPGGHRTQEIRLVEKAVESLGISKAAVKTNTGTKTATVTHLAKVKPDRRLAAWEGMASEVRLTNGLS